MLDAYNLQELQNLVKLHSSKKTKVKIAPELLQELIDNTMALRRMKWEREQVMDYGDPDDPTLY